MKYKEILYETNIIYDYLNINSDKKNVKVLNYKIVFNYYKPHFLSK